MSKRIYFTRFVCILLLMLNEQAFAKNDYRFPNSSISFESPEKWPAGVEYNRNQSYMTVFKVPDNEGLDKEYGRSLYIKATRLKINFLGVANSIKFRIENSKGSKIIYEEFGEKHNENAFFIWSYLDYANKTKYVSAERVFTAEGFLVRIVMAWPMLNNCSAERIRRWLDEMSKFYKKVKVDGEFYSKVNPLTMGMSLSNESIEKNIQPFCL